MQCPIEQAQEPRVAEIAGRDVDGHVQRESVLPPDARLQQRFTKHPGGERVHQALALRGRQEGVRRYETLLRMLPAHERLNASQCVAADVEDRLVVKLELVLRDRALELETTVAPHGSVTDESSGGAPFQSVAPVGGGVRPR